MMDIPEHLKEQFGEEHIAILQAGLNNTLVYSFDSQKYWDIETYEIYDTETVKWIYDGFWFLASFGHHAPGCIYIITTDAGEKFLEELKNK